MKNVIDYAHSELRNDRMDVFCMSQCRFLLGTTSGPSAATFGVPLVMTNVVPRSFRSFSRHDLLRPKLYRSRRRDAYLSFGEAIRDAAIEMIERLDGRATYNDQDQALQAGYDRLFTRPTDDDVGGRQGRNFLRRHADLL